MIIGFAGRMRSGKTELSRICTQYGYIRLSFAIPLKELCAKLLGIATDELNTLKNNKTPIDFVIDEGTCTLLSEETNIPLGITRETCEGHQINDVRDLLQFIGTDYIRKHNTNWHVNRLRERINPNENYVFDDVRFPNEKKMIEELGGDCWFVTRTTLDNISSHPSETSITWKDCWNKVIINNSSLEELLFKWNTFFANYKESCNVRDKEFERILENGDYNEIKPLSMSDMMLLSKSMFTYVPKDLDIDKIEGITLNASKTLTITYKDGSIEIIENPLNIEDLKMYVKKS